MALTERLQPASPNTVLFVLLGWTALMLGITRAYDSLGLRLVAVLGIGLLLAWWVWAVYRTLPRRKHRRITRNT